MANDDLEAIPFIENTMSSRRAPSSEYPPSPHPEDPLTPNSAPLTPVARRPDDPTDGRKFGDLGEWWVHVDKMTNQYHDELVRGLKSNLDNLLIFAALFSAVNSTFMGFSLPALSPAPADQTNKLLRLMLEGYTNSTLTPDILKEDDFNAKTDDLRVNQLFSISLTFSLLASFGALLGQQWVIHYSKRSPAGSERERWERQRKLEAAHRWYFEPIVEIVLPGLLQFALFIFMIGFLDFLYGLSPVVALPNAILTGLAVFTFLLTILASIRDPYCPFRTAAPKVFGALFRAFLNWFFDRFPKAMSRFTDKIEQEVAKGLDKDYLSIWRRDPESIPVLTVRSARTLLETSEEYKALLDTARNIPLLHEKEELAHIYNSRVAMHRLRELAGKETGETTTFSEALCHLELIVKPPESKPASQAEKSKQLVIFERAAEGHIRDVNDLVSFLPTSVATVTFVATQSLALGASMWSLRRHQKYLLDSLQKSPNPLVTVGLVAWMLLSNRDYIGNTSQRSRILADMGIVHELRPSHAKQELDDIAAALRAFEALGTHPSREAESRLLHFVLKALQNCRGQARSTHKFLIVLTTGLNQLLSNHEQSWQLNWSDVLLLIKSLGTLLDDRGSEARPLMPGAFEDAEEEETEDDWNRASEDAVDLVGKACETLKRWNTPDKFAEEAAGSDALLSTFSQYIKHLTKRYSTAGRPLEDLPFEEFAKYIENVPKSHITCNELVYADFKVAWQVFQGLRRTNPPPGQIRVDSFHSQGESTSAAGHNAYLSDGGETAVSDADPRTSTLFPRRPAFPTPRPASLMSIPSWNMSPSERYSRGADVPEDV